MKEFIKRINALEGLCSFNLVVRELCKRVSKRFVSCGLKKIVDGCGHACTVPKGSIDRATSFGFKTSQ
jgi:hypothetical protein